jgi:hypothetical protein
MVEQADTGWGRLYVFLTPQGYRTVSCSRSILLWRCPAAVTAPESRTRKPITVGTHVVFQWPKAMFLHEIAPIALSAEGKTLYEYRTPNNAHISMPDDLKWYPAPPGT